MPLSCHCGAEITGWHHRDCGHYEPLSEKGERVTLKEQTMGEIASIEGDLARIRADLRENADLWKVIAKLLEQERQLQTVRMRLVDVSRDALKTVLEAQA